LPLRIDYDIILVAYKKDTQSQTQLTEEWTVSSWIVKKEENTQNCEKQQKEGRVGSRGSNGLFIGARFPWEAVSRTAHFSKKARNRRGNGRFGVFKGDI
jgi:hypothetical protein